MKFEKIEIIGFKSFAEKTVVQFQPGMTAIVGPNGCGKSNIADAIRWVLGEQSAKQMRGERMDDVIFAGSTKRKPTGLAEVSLTISGVEGKISSEFGEFTELTITRRLYRSGESDYLINKVHSRLRDIRDIFLDTGVGARAFAIMEQGRIDAVLTKEPEDRRFIIEEVAGIMKYKARKTEALSRLESTEQNLVRVRDIIAEIKRQLGSLERQAKKAERYHTLQQQLKEAELIIARRTWVSLAARRREHETETESLRARDAAAEAAATTLENRIAEHRLHLAEAEKAVTDTQQGVHSLEKDIQQAESSITLARSQVISATERGARAKAEAERLEADLQNTTLLMEQQEKERAEAEATLAQEQKNLLERNTILLEKSKGLRQRETALDEDKSELFHLAQKISDARNRIAAWEAKEQNLSHREERRDTELRETQRELASNEEALSIKREAEAKVRATLEKHKQEQQEIAEALRENTEKLRQCRQELAAGRDTITRTASRLNSLQELEQNLEGFQDGVKAVMKSKKETLEGIRGVVAQFLIASPGYEVAIEAALGDRLQHVVVDDQRRGGSAINFLKSGNAGRATFLPMNPRNGRTQRFAPTDIKNDSGVIGRALDLLECRDGYRDVVEHLLGDVVIVRDLDAAMAIWDKETPACTLVTLDGEVVYPSGAITGGGGEKLKGGLLSKKREIKDLQEALRRAEEEHAALAKREEEMVTTEKNLAARRDELVKTLHAVQIEEVHCQKDIAALMTEAGRLGKKKELLEFEQQETKRERTDLAQKIGEVEETITSLTQRKEALEAGIGEKQEELGWLRDEVEEMREEVTRLTV
ncbi:MAG: chromosome segregation protein SMC, partial [Nitrospirota bacterium]|nr:chromosome segregation protein SMC [Nitrospirota bacterium]